MERPSKRRRLYQREGLRKAHGSFPDLQEPETNIARFIKDNPFGDKASLLQTNSHGASNDLKQTKSVEHKMQMVHPRQMIPNPVSQVAQSVTTAVESVVRVIIDNPSGTAIGDVLVPAQSSVFAFDGYGSVTLPSSTGSSTTAPQPPTRFESPSSAITPGSQSQAPQSTQQLAPTSTDQSAARPSGTPPANVSVSTNSQASQSPMTINVPGSSSQVVLSSPPTTPVPSSLSSSTSSTSASGTESPISYFTLSTSASSASTPFQTPATPSPSQILASLNVPAPTNSNFSMTSSTSSQSSQTSTGSRGPTSLTFATPVSNSTLLTSTTISSPSSSGLTTLSTTSSQMTSTRTNSSSTTSTSSSSSQSSTLSSSSFTSATSSIGAVPGGIGGATSSPTGTAPSSTASPGNGSGATGNVSTASVVGGVVGGVAGLTVILLLILLFFRWRRKNMTSRRDISPPMAPTIPPASGAPSGTATQRSSNVPFATAGFFKRMRPHSSATAATTETAPSERGFQNFGGRKLDPILATGGDGWGNPGPSGAAGPSSRPVRGFGVSPAAGLGAELRPATPQSPLSETSFYRDSQGFYGGAPEPEIGSNLLSMHGRPESPPPRSPDRPTPQFASSPLARVGSQAQRDQEVAFMRPGPARTPVTNQPGFPSLRQPTPTGRGTPPPRPLPAAGASPTARDGVGRSHPSFDGSRGSRFTEEIAPP